MDGVMLVVLGIGNPGEKYEKTRHNVGFQVLDVLCEKGDGKFRKAGFEYHAAEIRLAGQRALLVRPWTYVNGTGRVIPELRKRHGDLSGNFLVVCDDFALPVGALRLRQKGSSGGHNGLKSIIASLGSEAFSRLRIGIGTPPGTATGHVLNRFSREEREDIDEAIREAAGAVDCWAAEGIGKAMSLFNRTPPSEKDDVRE